MTMTVATPTRARKDRITRSSRAPRCRRRAHIVLDAPRRPTTHSSHAYSTRSYHETMPRTDFARVAATGLLVLAAFALPATATRAADADAAARNAPLKVKPVVF